MATASETRLAANARNALRSTGPRTEAGKARSSRNAIKHGLTAKDAVLPNEDPAAFQEQLDLWLAHDRPTDPAHAAVIERAVVSKWKLDRCTRWETQRLSEKLRHADDLYDFEKTAAAESLGRRLFDDPVSRRDVLKADDPAYLARIEKRLEDDPAILAKQLQTTAQGVDWLLARWAELAEMLDLHKFWLSSEKYRALWMLGRRPQDIIEDRLVSDLFLWCNLAHPDVSNDNSEMVNLWEECYLARMNFSGRPLHRAQFDNLRLNRPPDAASAVARLRDVVATEVARLTALKRDHLDPIDRLDRASARERAMIGVDKEDVLLRRYETAVEREFHRSIADLVKLRKEARPAPEHEPEIPSTRNEPVAEPSVEQRVASSDIWTPRFEELAERPGTDIDSPVTQDEPVFADV